ncbi:S-layer homology domain-containing protein [Paenibacillus brevis]|uniref:S-layer homology domain-containing protein n=1 Tax=Paenibacillus brevis TaxID=2841508 RepID=A0ABS6FNC8_9BACL|nr:S-layer homology domain-containing protein [Paenibacillus brevis]MBU5671676.1 S-layer homology domain-containing protein [Paenibacillus brevis]
MKLKKKINKLLSVALSAALVTSLFAQMASPTAAAPGEPVKVWLTTGDKSNLLTPQNDIAFQPDHTPTEYTINVDEDVKYQEIDGFGASMTDSSAWLLFEQLDAAQREEAMRKLFDPAQGAGFSYIRIPMGASDFALDKYTYNDLPGGVTTDVNLDYFSIEHDMDYILPILKQALEINPDLKFMGSPWSAPAWMKTSGSLMKGKLKQEYYDVYAQYFVKFIEAYKQAGIEIDAVTLQNEPQYEPDNYSGMKMDPEDQAAFVKVLGPALEAAKLSTKIIIWDHNWDNPDYPIEVLSDNEVYSYIAGSAFHGYAGNVESQSIVHDRFPDKGIYFTESSGGEFAPNFGDNLAWDVQNLIIGATRNWAKTSLKWNFALDEDNGPYVGGCEDCRGIVTVDRQSKNVTYNEEYYSFGHASKFVQPGAVRIKTNTFGSGGIENVAFLNPDGTKALIVLNSSRAEREFKVRSGNESFVYTLPAGAVATFTWEGTPGSNGPDMVTPYSRVEAEDYDALSSSYGVSEAVVTDAGGGKSVSLSGQGYLAYSNVEFVDGTASVQLRVAAEGESRIELRLDSPNGQLIGSADLSSTGGLQNWTTQSASIEGANGVHTLYLVMDGSVRLNWFQFSKTSYLDTMNYIGLNGGFELGDLSGWSSWNTKGTAHKVEAGGGRSGEYKLNHWFSEGYEQYTYRTVKVPNGTYKASVWVNKADNINSKLEVKNYGGPNLAADMGDMYLDWTQFTIENIRVTNGQLEIGVKSSSARSEWANYDDFELYRVTTKAPAKPTGINPPPEPETVTAGVYEGQDIQLDWTPVQEATGYKVYRSLTDLSQATVTDDVYVDFAEVGIVSAGTTTFTDTGLLGSTTYHYAVSAFNEDGESAVTRSVSATTETGQDRVPPAAPQGLRAEAGIEQVTLYWEPNLERDFAKYNIYRNGSLIGSINTITQTQYTVRGLIPGENYIFAVSAVDKNGNESPYSEAVAASPTASGTKLEFDNMDFEKGSLEGWSEWHPEAQPVANFVDDDNPRGSYKLTHWSGDDYVQSTYRTLELPNGTYKVQVWARTGGGQNKFQLEVKNYGGSELTKDMKSAGGGTWSSFAIDQIKVTNGQMELAVFSDAKAGNWAAIDDFEIYTYAPNAPAGLTGRGGDGKAYLEWTANTEYDLESYYIYQDGVKINTIPASAGNKPGKEITGLTNGVAYSFAVSAVDKDQNESLKSAAISITPSAPSPGGSQGPASPSGNAATTPSVPSAQDPDLQVKDGTVNVSLEKGKQQLLLPANASALDGKNRLTIQKEQLALSISAKVIEALKGLLPTQDLAQAQLSFELGSPEAEQTKKLIDQARSSTKANLAITGEMIALRLSAIAQDGTEYKLSELPEPIVVEWQGIAAPSAGLLGAYYVSEDGQLTYAGGALNNGIFSVQVDRLGRNIVLLSFDKSYGDVGTSHWAYAAIQSLSAQLLVNGVAEAQFAPQAQITRAEFAALIARALDLKPAGSASFNDVDSTKWYAEAIRAAHAAGIISGRSSDSFAPNAAISRQEMVKMLVQAYESRNGPAAEGNGAVSFADRDQISPWAEKSVAAAAELGLIQGKGSGAFDPQGAASRAESVVVISRLLEQLK